MKKFVLILMLLCFVMISAYEGIPANTEDGNSGVKFENLSLKEALAKAANENKLVLIDVFSYG